MKLWKLHSKAFIVVLSILFFTIGFVFERSSEHSRLQTLVKSSQQAERDYQDLIFAYELRLNTVHSLVSLAYKHRIAISSALVEALDGMDKRPDLSTKSRLQKYEEVQARLDNASRDLIVTMDDRLGTGDEEFVRLYREYSAEQQSLMRIRQSYAQQTRRVRALARKGDRRFLSPGTHLPASVEEYL